MAKIYWRRYKEKVDSGEMSVSEVIELVPIRWRDEVLRLFQTEE